MSDDKIRFMNLWADWFGTRGSWCYSFIPLNLYYIPRRKGGNYVGFIGVVILNFGLEYRIGDWARDSAGGIL